ncbi:MAG: DUF4386 domain-containing protein [Chloroflexota bacterium]
MNTKTNLNKTARFAGILYLLVAVSATFTVMYGPSSLTVPGDAAATFENIVAGESLFRLSIVSEVIGQIAHVWLVLALYKLLKSVSQNQAVLMVVLGLLGVPIALLNVLNNFAVLMLVSGADYLTVFSAEQLQALVMFFLDILNHGFYIAFIPWGLWLYPLGYLVFKSGYIPKILGILLIIACFGYLIDFVTLLLLPNFVEIRVFTFIGELLLPLWLVIRGVGETATSVAPVPKTAV